MVWSRLAFRSLGPSPLTRGGSRVRQLHALLQDRRRCRAWETRGELVCPLPPFRGLRHYETRPQGCREFYCEWMLSEKLGPEWKPDRARFAVMMTATGHLSLAVDPGFPFAWKHPRYYEPLVRWTRERAEDASSAWPGVDVWIGRRCIIILPDGEKDLGTVAANEEVRIDLATTPEGAVYTVTKFVPDACRGDSTCA